MCKKESKTKAKEKYQMYILVNIRLCQWHNSVSVFLGVCVREAEVPFPIFIFGKETQAVLASLGPNFFQLVRQL